MNSPAKGVLLVSQITSRLKPDLQVLERAHVYSLADEPAQVGQQVVLPRLPESKSIER